MPSLALPLWTPAVSELGPDTLPTERLPQDLDLGDGDTIAVPLASADTLPCPRLVLEDVPTLRASKEELARLIRLTEVPGVPPPIPRLAPCPADRPQAIRPADSGPTLLFARRPQPAAPLPVGGLPMRVPPRPEPERPQLPPGPGSERLPLFAGRSFQPVALRGAGELMPTQLWLGPVGPPGATIAAARATGARAAPRRPARLSLWARVWRLLGWPASRPPGRRTDHRPGCR